MKLKLKIILVLWMLLFVFPVKLVGAVSVETIQVEAEVNFSGSQPEETPSSVQGSSSGAGFYIPPSLDKEPPLIFGISILEITYNSALIVWETNEETLGRLIYELKPGLEKEIKLSKFSKTHALRLSDLEPASLYKFKIEAQDKSGNISTSPSLQFRTLPLPDIIPPANVSGFKAEYKEGKVILSWKNPLDKDLAGIKIVRSEKEFPKLPFQGKVIFEGREEKAEDLNIQEGKTYYYSAFSFDFAGNFSSGALAKVKTTKIFYPPKEPIPRKKKEIIPLKITVSDEEKIYLKEVSYDIKENELKIKALLPVQKSKDLNREFKIHTLKNYSFNFGFKIENPPKSILSAYLYLPTINEVYLLSFKDKEFKAKIKSPPSPGSYEAFIIIAYQDGTRDIIEGKILIDPYGYVYKILKPTGEELRIEGAKVFLFWFNLNQKTWEIWPAKDFNQENPQITDKTGEYAFLVPKGEYYLKVTKEGYYPFVSLPFKVDRLVVNLNIELKPYLREDELFIKELWFRRYLIGGILIIGSLTLIFLRKKRKNEIWRKS